MSSDFSSCAPMSFMRSISCSAWHFILEAVDLDFGGGWLAVRGFKLGQVAFDARLKLFQPLGYLGFVKFRSRESSP